MPNMKRLLLILVTMTACMAAWAAEGYAVFTPYNSTLTFYYGTKPDGAFSLNSSFEMPGHPLMLRCKMSDIRRPSSTSADN